jgi:hypothetical protein
MKLKTLLLASTAALFSLSYTSCKKNSNNNTDSSSATIEATADQSISDNLADDANDAMNENVSANELGSVAKGQVPPTQNPSTCATVTVQTTGGGFPKTLTITFDHCPGIWNPNIVRNGVITVVLSDSMRKIGSTATTTFSNYTVTHLNSGNTFQVEGTHVWTNTGGVPGVSRSWSRRVTNGRITNLTTGHYWLHSGFRNVSVNFNGTQFPGDDIITVAAGGYHQITNPMGTTHYDTVMTDLVRYIPCRWFHSGTIKHTGPNHTVLIDFGYNPTNSASCDDDATRSVDGGTPIAFHLP